MNLAAGSVQFTHVPSAYSFDMSEGGGFSEPDRLRLREIQVRLTQYPQLLAQVAMPAAGEAGRLAKLRKVIHESIPLASDSSRVAIVSSPDGSRGCTITLSSSPASQPPEK